MTDDQNEQENHIENQLENEYNEAKTVVDELLKNQDYYTLYRMYTIGKVLVGYLDYEVKNQNETAKTVYNALKDITDYFKSKEPETENKH